MNDIMHMLVDRVGLDKKEAEKTFQRWWSWMVEVTADRSKQIKDHFNAVEKTKADQMIIVRDINANLVCPHHLLPVRMIVHIGYVPYQKQLGLSKFARVARDLCRPITQEEYTHQLVDTIWEGLEPKWIMAIVEGQHDCMQVRGVESIHSKTETLAIESDLEDPKDIRSYKEEFMRRIQNGH